jgi:hypothetical protein
MNESATDSRVYSVLDLLVDLWVSLWSLVEACLRRSDHCRFELTCSAEREPCDWRNCICLICLFATNISTAERPSVRHQPAQATHSANLRECNDQHTRQHVSELHRRVPIRTRLERVQIEVARRLWDVHMNESF